MVKLCKYATGMLPNRYEIFRRYINIMCVLLLPVIVKAFKHKEEILMHLNKCVPTPKRSEKCTNGSFAPCDVLDKISQLQASCILDDSHVKIFNSSVVCLCT